MPESRGRSKSQAWRRYPCGHIGRSAGNEFTRPIPPAGIKLSRWRRCEMGPQRKQVATTKIVRIFADTMLGLGSLSCYPLWRFFICFQLPSERPNPEEQGIEQWRSQKKKKKGAVRWSTERRFRPRLLHRCTARPTDVRIWLWWGHVAHISQGIYAEYSVEYSERCALNGSLVSTAHT